MTPKDFRTLLEPSAAEVSKRFFIPWQVMVAIVANETGWLKSPIKDISTEKDSHNLFAIKADESWHGPSVVVKTHEEVNGVIKAETCRFRAYASYTEAFGDFAKFIMTNSRYKEAMKHTNDPVRFAHELAAAGYATDSRYAAKLTSIMRQHLGVK